MVRVGIRAFRDRHDGSRVLHWRAWRWARTGRGSCGCAPPDEAARGSGAIEIVDIYHAKQHLSDATKALYGPGADRADAWARQRHDELDDGRLRAIVAELGFHSKTSDAARRRLDYIVRNRRRMRCPRFRARGLCVSSGVVEAGCKRVVGARLKRAGLRWTVAGANAIIARAAAQLSGRCEDYWEQRAARAA